MHRILVFCVDASLTSCDIFWKIYPIVVYHIKTGIPTAVNHDKLYNEISF